MRDNVIRVLLIEDNPGDARLIREMLGTATNPRLEMDHAESLQAGLERLTSQPVDVLLLDLGLPGSEGLTTVAKATAAAPDLPIIVLTGTDTPRTVLDAIKAGVRDYFIKSRIAPEALIEAILRQAARNRQIPTSDVDEAPPASAAVIRPHDR